MLRAQIDASQSRVEQALSTGGSAAFWNLLRSPLGTVPPLYQYPFAQDVVRHFIDAPRLRLYYAECSRCHRTAQLHDPEGYIAGTGAVKGGEDFVCRCCARKPKHGEKLGVNVDRATWADRFAQPSMDPGELPDALQGLSWCETLLIQRASVVMSLHVCRGAVYFGLQGHTLMVPQDVQKIVDVLPRAASELDVIVLRQRIHAGRQQDPGAAADSAPATTVDAAVRSVQYKIRRNKVLDALRFLQANNPKYEDIRIDPERVEALPVDGSLADLLPAAVVLDLPARTDGVTSITSAGVGVAVCIRVPWGFPRSRTHLFLAFSTRPGTAPRRNRVQCHAHRFVAAERCDRDHAVLVASSV
jgi:hypothetical protein